jgi:hypothetical protein
MTDGHQIILAAVLNQKFFFYKVNSAAAMLNSRVESFSEISTQVLAFGTPRVQYVKHQTVNSSKLVHRQNCL